MARETTMPSFGGGDLGVFALEWLIWPERIAGRPRAHALSANDPAWGFRSQAFDERMSAQFRHLKVDDIQAIAHTLAEHCDEREGLGLPVLPWLYEQCLNDAVVDIQFDRGIPAIRCPPTAFSRWLRLAGRIDPDALVCMALAKQFPGLAVDDVVARMVARWPVVFSIADHDFRQLMSKGVTDLHLHLKSLWPAALSWQRVLPDALNRGEGKPLDKLPVFKDIDPVSPIWQCLIRVAGERQLRRCTLLDALRPASVPFFETADLLPNPIGSVLQSERLMLIGAWQHVFAGKEGSAAIEAELDAYITGKSIFRALHTQSAASSNKGLVAFDRVRRMNSHLGRFDREETAGARFSVRRFRRNNGFLFLALRDSSALRKTEVRIAPPGGATKHLVKAYGATLLATDSLIKSLAERHPDEDWPEIKVALHFKRAVEDARSSSSEALPTMALLRKLLEFDRDTASFQDYRIRTLRLLPAQSPDGDPDQRAALARVSRLDLASPERGAGPWLIAPYIRLLKGDALSLNQLGTPLSRAYLPKWSCLWEQGRARPPLGSPHPRLTCHAGEDFYTLVDGIWHIEGAISAWSLGPGDALGHCLALGLDPHRQLDALDQIRIPTGVELDSMIWLRRMAKEIGFSDASVIHRLEQWIAGRAADVYACDGAAIQASALNLSVLEEKILAAGEPLLVPESYAPPRLPISSIDPLPGHIPSAYRLRLLDLFDPGVARRRQRRKKPSQLHRSLPELIIQVQNEVLDQISRKGIAIETNPSSNMRMERIHHPAELPICSIMTRSGPRARVTICTDNPGTYDANIETEYALMFSALLKLFGEERRDEVLAQLDRMRETGSALFGGF